MRWWMALVCTIARVASAEPAPDHGHVSAMVLFGFRMFGDANIETRRGVGAGGAIRIPGTLLAGIAEAAYGSWGSGTSGEYKFVRATAGLELGGTCMHAWFVDAFGGYQNDALGPRTATRRRGRTWLAS